MATQEELDALAKAEAEAKDKSKTAKKPKMITVVSKKDGFRRAGREWVGTTEIDPADLKKGELEQLKAEPMLTVIE